MSSTAAANAASFALAGLLKPLIFLTNCSDAARISSSVTGGSKLNSVLMLLHTACLPGRYLWLTRPASPGRSVGPKLTFIFRVTDSRSPSNFQVIVSTYGVS